MRQRPAFLPASIFAPMHPPGWTLFGTSILRPAMRRFCAKMHRSVRGAMSGWYGRFSRNTSEEALHRELKSGDRQISAAARNWETEEAGRRSPASSVLLRRRSRGVPNGKRFEIIRDGPHAKQAFAAASTQIKDIYEISSMRVWYTGSVKRCFWMKRREL